MLLPLIGRNSYILSHNLIYQAGQEKTQLRRSAELFKISFDILYRDAWSICKPFIIYWRYLIYCNEFDIIKMRFTFISTEYFCFK